MDEITLPLVQRAVAGEGGNGADLRSSRRAPRSGNLQVDVQPTDWPAWCMM
jgi:hypothetical protein